MNTNISSQINSLIQEMEPISLGEMDHVKLMRRRDTKYVFSIQKLPQVLQSIQSQYRVLTVDGHRAHPYSTMYYDTPGYDMYHNHHGKRLNRYKIRMREYVVSGLTFLEIKFKNNKGETVKKRINPHDPVELGDIHSDSFLQQNSPYSSYEIEPALHNSFDRITLVNKHNPERVTIDTNLRFEVVDGEQTKQMKGICIVEVKRDLTSQMSDMVLALRKARIQPMGFSKYCMGTAMINSEVRRNLFKGSIRYVNKLNNQLSYI